MNTTDYAIVEVTAGLHAAGSRTGYVELSVRRPDWIRPTRVHTTADETSASRSVGETALAILRERSLTLIAALHWFADEAERELAGSDFSLVGLVYTSFAGLHVSLRHRDDVTGFGSLSLDVAMRHDGRVDVVETASIRGRIPELVTRAIELTEQIAAVLPTGRTI